MVRLRPVAGLVTTIVAPGTSSPLAFLIVPTIWPVLACDCAIALNAHIATSTREVIKNCRDLDITGELLEKIRIVETSLRASHRAPNYLRLPRTSWTPCSEGKLRTSAEGGFYH